METVMSLGYVKGQYWVTDDVFAAYAKRSSYQRFLVALRQAGYAIQCSYSYIARRYTAEIITFERLKGSSNLYFFKHNNAYDANPLSAMGQAATAFEGCTPLIRAIVLEMETELLVDAYRAAVQREQEQARVEAKLLPILNMLEDALGRVPIKFMHGDTDLGTVRVSELRSKPLSARTLNMMAQIDGCYDEDDDL